MPPSRPSRLKKLLGFAGVSAAALVGTAVFATAASAHAPAFTASSDCHGVVHFAAEAWAGEAGSPATDAERTHEDMAVKVSDDGQPWHDLPGTYAFNAADDFKFAGDYTPPAGWASIRIQSFSRSFAEASSPVLTVTAATGCVTPPAQPSASVADASCADHGAVVTLKNEGGTAVEFDVNGEKVTVGPNDTATKTVTFPADTPTDITVTAPGYQHLFEDLDYHCSTAVPAANVANATCADSGAVVHLVNTGDAPAVFTIKVPGSPDTTVTVPANGTSDQTVPVPEGATKTVTVTSADMADVTKDLNYSCTTPTPPTPPADNTLVVPPAPEQPVFVAPEVAVPVEAPAVSAPVSNTAVAPATAEVAPTPTPTPTPAPSPPTQVLGETATAGAPAAAAPSSATLPFTGSDTGPMTLTAFGSLLAGLAMVFAGRRRSTHQ